MNLFRRFRRPIRKHDWVRVKKDHLIYGQVYEVQGNLVTFVQPAYSPVWGGPIWYEYPINQLERSK